MGRLGEALSCHLLEQEQDAATRLHPTRLTPGAMGIAKELCGFTQVAQTVLSKPAGRFAEVLSCVALCPLCRSC